MTSHYGIVLGLFDHKEGPYRAFARNISQDKAKNIIIKGTIIQGSLDLSKESQGESILSFPSDEMASFLFLSSQPYRSNEEELPLIIAFTIHIKSQFQLYRDAIELRKIANIIKDEMLAVLVKVNERKKIEISLRMLMNGYFSDEIIEQLLEPNIVLKHKQNSSNAIIKKLVSNFPPLTTLTQLIEKNLDQAVFGLIIGIPVAVISLDPNLIEYIFQAVEYFVPHRKIRKSLNTNDLLTKNPIIDYDLVGTTSNNKPLLKNFIIIDLDKRKVFGGRKNKYCEKLIHDLVDAEIRSPKLPTMLAKRRIEWLIMSASSITQIQTPEQQKLAVDELIQKMDRDSLFIIAKFLEDKNPVIFHHITRNFSLRNRLLKSLF